MENLTKLAEPSSRAQSPGSPSATLYAERQHARKHSGVDAHLVSLVATDSYEAEQYRRLRLTVERMRKPGESAIVGVCSPVAGDGKSVTSINLAGALAQDPKARVLLVEIDLHRPYTAIVDYLALDNPAGPGLVNVIQDPSLALDEVIRHLPAFNLSVLLGGSHSTSIYEILESDRLGELLAEMRRRYDYIVLDAPPVVPVLDCRLIEKWVDGFIVVVAAHQTPRRMLEEALNHLSPEKVMGLVFNRNDRPSTYTYGYDYAYAHGYGRPMRRRRAGRRARMLRQRIKARPQIGTIEASQQAEEKQGQ